MALASGLYLFNLICTIVPCSATQPPPEAFINEFANSNPINDTNLIGIGSESKVTLNQIDPVLLNENNSDEQERNLRKRRLDDDIPTNPFQNNEDNYNDNDFNIRNRYKSNRNNNLRNTRRPIRMEDNNLQTNSLFSNNLLFSAIPIIPVLLNNFMRNRNTNNRAATGLLSNNNGGRLSRSNKKSRDDPPIVFTNYGSIEGYYMGTMKGRKISAFEGIPYAEPPIGKYRFMSPVPKYPWKNTLQAKQPGGKCIQGHPLDFFQVTGIEDCLRMNIYVPKTFQTSEKYSQSKLGVIFFVHGGSFMYGSGSEYGPAYLLDEDVILVTFNYRLGPLGFLSTGDDSSPGNYGLKDQALALKWVYENIAAFSGDNNKITIMGQSAGAVSAHLHLISNKTTQYFQNGVSLSGSGFGFWPIVTKRRSTELTKKLATALNCPTREGSSNLIKCMKNLSAQWIISAQLQVYDWIPMHPLVLFAPTIEPEGPEAFLTKSPEEAYANNEVMNKTWIFGQTSQEGHFLIHFMKLLMQATPIALNGKRYLPKILDYEFYTRQPRTSEITNKVLEFYGGSLGFTGIDMNYLSDMITDRLFTSTIRKAIESHSTVAPTYAYIFDYKGKYNLGSLFGAAESEWGAAHTEDLFYFFNSSAFHHGLKRNDQEYALSQIMTDILANFASTGKPIHIDSDNREIEFWTPAISNETFGQPIQYLKIHKDIKMISDPYAQRVEFWDSLQIPTT